MYIKNKLYKLTVRLSLACVVTTRSAGVVQGEEQQYSPDRSGTNNGEHTAVMRWAVRNKGCLIDDLIQ